MEAKENCDGTNHTAQPQVELGLGHIVMMTIGHKAASVAIGIASGVSMAVERLAKGNDGGLGDRFLSASQLPRCLVATCCTLNRLKDELVFESRI
jgi:hypothetical protein